jgi:hypothetical protein
VSRKRVVYFMKPIGMDGPIKIGVSANGCEKRLMKLSVWSPFPLEIIGTIPGWTKQEAYLHRRFAGQHSHREWFHSSELLWRTIHRLLAGETVEIACADIPANSTIKVPRRVGGDSGPRPHLGRKSRARLIAAAGIGA